MSSSNEATQLANRLNNTDHNRPPIQNNRAAVRGRDADRFFPAKFDFDPNDKADRMRELKMSLPEDQFGQKFLEKEDLEYVDKKAQEIELEKFDRWYATIFDHSDPAQLQLSKQIYPEWFERRLKAIDETVDFQRRMAKMQMLGIQSKEDVLTAYALASGRVDPQVYNMNVMNPVDQGENIMIRQYQYGFFNPYRYQDRVGRVGLITSATQPLTHLRDNGGVRQGIDSRAQALNALTPGALGQLMAGQVPAGNRPVRRIGLR